VKSKFLLVVILISFAGCRNWNGIRGSGNIEEETRKIEKFEELEVSDAFSIRVTLGEEPSLKLKGDDNLLKYVKISNKGDRLIISTRKNINQKELMLVTITNPSLKKISASGANNINVRNIETERFNVDVSGACSIDLKGNAENLRIEMSGACSLDSEELISRNVKIDCSGASSAIVYAGESLTADISGASHVKFAGNPSHTDLDASGVSSIDAIDE